MFDFWRAMNELRGKRKRGARCCGKGEGEGKAGTKLGIEG